MKFSQLPIKLQERIEDTQLTLYILDAAAPERAKLDIFERVNNGVPLSRQQMRNCLFNGPATQWLKSAANSDEFLAATGKSLDAKLMRDREAINRFCAFYLLGEDVYRGDMDAFLAQALEKMQSDVDLEVLRLDFFNAMTINQGLFGDHAFRKSLVSYMNGNNPDRSVLNISLFDVCSVIFSKFDIEFVKERAGPVRDVICELLNDAAFLNSITYSTNSSRQIQTRFSMARNALAKVLA